MRKGIKSIIFLVLLAFFLIGCQSNETNEDLFQYKNSYVGDNGAVSNIIYQLKSNDEFDGFELKTIEEPYGIIINYQQLESEKEQKETAVYNASFLLTLVQNADWVRFNFDADQYEITRKNLQDWYGSNFAEISSEDELELIIQKHLNN